MKQFQSLLESGKIKWQPWVGDNFLNGKHKILVVGESHYYNPNEEGSYEKHQTPTFTCEVIDEMARLKDYYQTKIFQNFHKAMMGNDDFNTDKFWHQLAFYNFIQRPMNSNKGRPSYNDFLESWEGFEEVVKILKPTKVIFIGTSAASAFNEFAKANNKQHNEVKWLDKIGTSYAKECHLMAGVNTPIIFIRHTSQYFSWRKWNEFLKVKLNNELNWLQNEVVI